MYRMIVHSPENDSKGEFSGIKSGTAVAIGKFDGTHIGHQKLIRELADTARTNNLIPTVLLINNRKENIEEKEEHIKRLFSFGAKAIVELDLTPEVKSMNADRFLREVLLDKLSMKYLLGGTDIAFGHERKGNADFLKTKAAELGFRYKLIDKVKLNDTSLKDEEKKTVSSTLLRQKIQAGDMEAVRNIMGTYFDITGTVQHGRHIGTDVLGVPTLNQAVEDGRCYPPKGVYVSRVILLPEKQNRFYYGISNLGVKPSIENGTDPFTLETHLFECPPDTDLYGKTVRTELLHYLRPEMKFDCVEDLGRQLHEKDIPDAVKQIEIIKNYQ